MTVMGPLADCLLISQNCLDADNDSVVRFDRQLEP